MKTLAGNKSTAAHTVTSESIVRKGGKCQILLLTHCFQKLSSTGPPRPGGSVVSVSDS